MEGGLSLSAAPLTALAGALGVAADMLAAVEGADRINHPFVITAEAAAALPHDLADQFAAAFGDAADVTIRTGELTELRIAPTFNRDEATAFAERAVDGGPYELLIKIDKDRLADATLGATARKVRLFLYAGGLRRLLARGITRIEEELWPHAPAPLAVGVLDTDVDLVGPHLAVVGGKTLHELSELANTAAVEVDFASLAQARDRHVAWDVRWTTGLTPWHFELAGSSSDPLLHGLLRAQLVKLAVLFTCDRTRSTTGVTRAGLMIRAEYRGREHLATITIDERQPVDVGTEVSADARGEANALLDRQVAAVLGGVDWCYRRRGTNEEPDWVSDRLPFLQTRIAQTLEPVPEDQRVGALVRAMPFVLDGIEWHWKAFVEGKVGDYLDQVEKVETAVADTVTSFAERSAALVKSLGEAVLAAVAVVVGSFIAAAYKDPFNATLFRIALRTYALYVALFPATVGLLANNHGLRVALTSHTRRIRRFKEMLHPDKVDDVVGDRVKNAKRSYYYWLAAVGAIYVVIAVSAWVASTVVPRQILSDPSRPPPTTAPTTAAPTPDVRVPKAVEPSSPSSPRPAPLRSPTASLGERGRAENIRVVGLSAAIRPRDPPCTAARETGSSSGAPVSRQRACRERCVVD